ncbi:MAG: phosphate signaling complex protein PhoU [Oscillospiraceae bacterium]|jgi:phosphate transport system protein|nr:phosphate signaling complex protein PhoU [Oscillospiraceae bacterium]
MRKLYEKQLEELHSNLIRMGALCELAIAYAAKALLDCDDEMRGKTIETEREIDDAEREIELLCVRLLLHQQPMASDLRHVTAAQRMIVDMERIGDQARDIAEISEYMQGSPVKSDVHISEMARSVRKMVTNAVEAFVRKDLALAHEVVAYDDKVDARFETIKEELVDLLAQRRDYAKECIDLLMIAKYLERIGDHAENVAEWVVYYLTGSREEEGA